MFRAAARISWKDKNAVFAKKQQQYSRYRSERDIYDSNFEYLRFGARIYWIYRKPAFSSDFVRDIQLVDSDPIPVFFQFSCRRNIHLSAVCSRIFQYSA